ncbi:hypothetical protein AgCh_022864 [Apium graveolens]
MKPTRYSYADIKKITSQFSEKLGQGGYGSVYKGQITNDFFVAVNVLNSDPKAKGEEFINEVGTIGRIYHVNVDQSIVSMTMARGTIGYIAPEVYSRNFGKVSSKSDVYSFGMLLLEMVGARDNNAAENTSETYFPEWIFHRLEEGGEVAIQIEKEEDSNIAKKLTIVGLWCIGWLPVDRPSMKQVINMLERQECPTMPPNPFRLSNVRPFANDLEVISESE